MEANKLIRTSILAITVAAGGGALCAQHPAACAVGAALVAGTAVAMVNAHGHRELPTSHPSTPPPPLSCTSNPALCQ